MYVCHLFAQLHLYLWLSSFELKMQPEKEFRPPMSEIVECLTRLSQKMFMTKSNASIDGTEVEPLFDRSFRSTQTCFGSSPAASLYIDGT